MDPVSIATSPNQSIEFPASTAGSPAVRRLIAAVIGTVCAAILSVAAWLNPSPTGVGTHEQLHLPQCGWITMADMPCPTCGMTTAFAHAAHGHIIQSFLAQPLGCILSIATAMALLVCAQVVVTGSRLGSVFARLWGRKTALVLSILVVAAWGFKILSYKGLL